MYCKGDKGPIIRGRSLLSPQGPHYSRVVNSSNSVRLGLCCEGGLRAASSSIRGLAMVDLSFRKRVDVVICNVYIGPEVVI